MLSRFAFKAGANARNLSPIISSVRPSASVPAMESKTEIEVRDEVNFPRPKRAMYPDPVRMGFIPNEWFQNFYNKTGVTGPYVFGAGLITFLLSKEYIILEHEFYGGIPFISVVIFGVYKFGPSVAKYLDGEVEKEEKCAEDFKQKEIKTATDAIETEKDAQWRANGVSVLYDARRENVGLQLEAAYRQRLLDIHHQVKQKLDYQLEVSNVMTRLEQQHMVNWIVENVRKSITPAQEAASLKQCITDLKAIAAKA